MKHPSKRSEGVWFTARPPERVRLQRTSTGCNQYLRYRARLLDKQMSQYRKKSMEKDDGGGCQRFILDVSTNNPYYNMIHEMRDQKVMSGYPN
ncbi:hypothetical protein QWT69_14065 [Sporosarcina oncorhynchi]|uniref:Uncharacterized protein n=1 Tax=Sporosarcina oncorhynchi TaxID=3056444 RepID=A0ABZ0L3D9_9BACL|nr:hypothetical protein [Sporosarcina sp. T2O-4]WOV86985.1 hypothetical protein QWT69_14065 [Sporosarcina sp. T2O-4]